MHCLYMSAVQLSHGELKQFPFTKVVLHCVLLYMCISHFS